VREAAKAAKTAYGRIAVPTLLTTKKKKMIHRLGTANRVLLSSFKNKLVSRPFAFASGRSYGRSKPFQLQQNSSNSKGVFSEIINRHWSKGEIFFVTALTCVWVGYMYQLYDTSEQANDFQDNNLAAPQGKITDRVFLDFQIGNEPLERVIIGLYGEECPKTVRNFKFLCQGVITEDDRPLTYKNCKVFHVNPRVALITGDNTLNNGHGGESVFEKNTFRDESHLYKHIGCGVVSMFSRKMNENISCFRISFRESFANDGRFVVFGQVLSGLSALQRIRNWKAEKPADKSGDTASSNNEIRIVNCGIITNDMEESQPDATEP
jgi:peptidyl-prolyl cis-trans isomerase B (cyclophilin B)